MLTLQTNATFSDSYEGWSETGTPFMFPFTINVFPFSKAITANSQLLSYAEGTRFLLRGINFHGYLLPIRSQSSELYPATEILGLGRMISSGGTAYTGTSVQSNILVNRQLYESPDFFKNLVLAITQRATGGNVSGISIAVICKKVNPAGSVTTLKTLTSGTGVTSTGNNQIIITDTTALSTAINEDDLIYLDIVISYTSMGGGGIPQEHGLGSSNRHISFTSII